MSSRVFLTLTIALAAATTRADALVAFRPAATIAGSLVTLGDVADVRSTDVVSGQQLPTIILGPAPAAGRETVITFEVVRSRLMAAGVNLSEVEFSGPSSVTVSGAEATPVRPGRRPRPQPPAGDVRMRAERAVSAAVRRYLASKGVASAVVEFNLPEAENAEVSAAESRGFEVTGGDAPWTGPQTFLLRFLDAAEQVREVRIGCVVSQPPLVLAARQALPKGHVLRPDDLVWKRAETDSEACAATDPRQLVGRETQQSIRTGQPIPTDAVRTLPLVRGGQFVTVTSRRPGVAVQRVMKAKDDGGIGELVSLTTLEDRKTVLARVTGLQEAEVVDPRGGRTALEGQGTAPPEMEVEPPPTGIEPAAVYAPRVRVNPTRPLSVPDGSADE